MAKMVYHGSVYNGETDNNFMFYVCSRDEREVEEWVKHALPRLGSPSAQRGLTIEGRSGIKDEDVVFEVEWQNDPKYPFLKKLLSRLSQMECIVITNTPSIRIGHNVAVCALIGSNNEEKKA